MSRKPNEAIYTELCQELTLGDHHRQSLKKKRGFTDATIDTLKYKTAKPENAPIINNLTEKYGAGVMYSCGLLDKDRKPAYQFTNPDYIIIPFLDTDGKTVKFYKSHKKGSLSGMGVLPYAPYLMMGATDTVILCESEFKAAAMWQLGYKAQGLCGINTFSGEHIGEIGKLVMGCKKVIILFDNEIQDDPSLPTYKEHFASRYAHFIWSYIMARRLEALLGGGDSKIDIRIATLPKSWIVDGKIDCDTALALGRTKDEFDIVIRDALPPEVYRGDLEIDREHIPWVNRRMEKAYDNNLIWSYGNCYYTKKIGGKKEEAVTKELSNFTIDVKQIIERDDGTFREVELVSKYKDRAGPLIVTPNEMASCREFKELCLSKGDFMWKGTDDDWVKVVEHLFLDSTAIPIRVARQIGRNEPMKMWMFGNVIIKDDGSHITLSEDGNTFYDGAQGYRIDTLGTGKMPELCMSPISPALVAQKFEEAWGLEGLIALAYAISTLFSNDVFEVEAAFPMMFVFGEKESGKTTLADYTSHVLGFKRDNPAMNLSDTTIAAMGRKMAYYSSLPLRFDEYRAGEKKIDDKISFLRSMYNRQTASKGIKEAFGIREVKTFGCVIMIGEERPSDSALQSRIIPIHVAAPKRTPKSGEALKWLHENLDRISGLTFGILKDYEKNRKRFMELFLELKKTFMISKEVEHMSRIRFHYAAILTAMSFFLDAERLNEVTAQIFQEFAKVVNEQKEGSIINAFFDDLVTMKDMGENVKLFLSVDPRAPKEGILYLNGLVAQWLKWKQSHGSRAAMGNATLFRRYMAVHTYCKLKSDKRRVPAGEGRRLNCMVMRLDDPSCPKEIKSLFEGVDYYSGGEYADYSDQNDTEETPDE
jgi:hypothetical protein